MAQKTIIQVIDTVPYTEIASYDFIYTPASNCELEFEGYIYIVNHIRDRIRNGGEITRLIRFQKTRKMQD